jgi:hypothetical protein
METLMAPWTFIIISSYGNCNSTGTNTWTAIDGSRHICGDRSSTCWSAGIQRSPLYYHVHHPLDADLRTPEVDLNDTKRNVSHITFCTVKSKGNAAKLYCARKEKKSALLNFATNRKKKRPSQRPKSTKFTKLRSK